MICIWFSILLVLNAILMQYDNNANNDYSALAFVAKDGYEQFPIIYNDTNLKAELVFKGLKFPTSMAFLGPNDILVLEKNNGTVKRIVNGKMASKPLLNVDVATEGRREDGRGMLGINVAKHGTDGPTYAFLYFIESSKEKEHGAKTGGKAVLYRYELKDNKLTNAKLLFDVSGPRSLGLESFHNGGKILIGPDQNIYLIVGDFSGHYTSTMNIQDRESADGKSGILRVTHNGKPIKGANILGNGDPLNKYFAYGIRNSFGMDFDPVTGKLWDTENGPDYGDEINLVEPGFNSGWNKVHGIWKPNPNGTLGDEVKSKDLALEDFDGKAKYSHPEFTWYHSIGPTSLIFLDSDKMGKKYRNDIFVADFISGNIYHFELNQKRTALSLNGSLADKVADTDVENKDITFATGFKGITDMQVAPDGYLYILSYNYGAIFRILPVQSTTPKQTIVNLLDENHIWKPYPQAMLTQNNDTLTINVDTNMTNKIYNRAFLPTNINYEMNKTLLLNLDYSSKSDTGNATFLAEIMENSSSYNTNGTKKILWSSFLHDTSGKLTNETFILPDEVVNKPVEFRLYAITNGPGEHILTVKKASIMIH